MGERKERKNTGVYTYENVVPDGVEKTTIASDVLEALKIGDVNYDYSTQ